MQVMQFFSTANQGNWISTICPHRQQAMSKFPSTRQAPFLSAEQRPDSVWSQCSMPLDTKALSVLKEFVPKPFRDVVPRHFFDATKALEPA